MEEKFFEARNLCFSYKKMPVCLDGVSFCINKNDKVLILASNEMGKTTLLSVLSSFDNSYNGDVFLCGNNLKEIDDNEKNFSFLPSYPVVLNNKTCFENIIFLRNALKNKDNENDLNKIFSTENIENVLKKYNLYEKKDIKLKKFSLFEKKVFTILRSELKSPEVLFLDNQFENLNEDEFLKMQEFYRELLNNKEKTLFFALNNEDYLKNKNLLKEFNISKILYLVDAKVYEFNSILEFENNILNINQFKFIENYFIYEGCSITLEDGIYYFLNQEYEYFELDKEFSTKLDELKLTLCVFEDITIVTQEIIDFKTISNQQINDLIKTKKIIIYSKIDGSRVL